MLKFVPAFLAGVALVIGSNILGHYYPPFSLMATAVLPFFIIAAVNYRLYKVNFLATVLLGYGLLLLNDWLVRVYAGGTHDQEGKAWTFLMSSIAFSFSTVCMLVYAYLFATKEKRPSSKGQVLQPILEVLLCAGVTASVYMYLLSQV